MYDFRADIFVALFGITAVVALLGARKLSGNVQKAFLFAGVIGLYFYSGIGAAYGSVLPQYRWSYVLFLLSFCVSFVVGVRLLNRHSKELAQVIGQSVSKAASNKGLMNTALSVYLLTYLLPLVYPSFQLGRLVRPPAPDLRSVFYGSLERATDQGIVCQTVHYVRVLAYPFFLLSLYRFRNRFGIVLGLFLAQGYLTYCATSYVGRSFLATPILLWVYNSLVIMRRKRALTLVVLALCTPFLASLLNGYVYTRIGGASPSIEWQQAAQDLLIAETSFPVDSTIIIHSGVRVHLDQYAKWLLTLPLPKALFGSVDSARVNYEISEVLLGMTRATSGWYVRLTGLVTESIYLYGVYFFPVHALMIGFLFAGFCSLTQYVREFGFLAANGVAMAAYTLNRAGISAVLPDLMNSFLLFYIWILVLYLSRRRAARSSVGVAGGG